MRMFHPENHNKTPQHQHLYAQTELAYTVVDFAAAALFVIGSIMFFYEATTYFGTWLFVIGSVLFGLRPTIKLYREFAYDRLNRQTR
ncbi:YrhK family protein [Algirhabdus cladophorae]|uniref:YrhK family protein n=1 Tax=Algirhabdus cladophorae TaxID=3377108 RepID=UPI003B845F42